MIGHDEGVLDEVGGRRWQQCQSQEDKTTAARLNLEDWKVQPVFFY